MTMLPAKLALCAHIFKGFVLYFSLKFSFEPSHLDSGDTNHKEGRQAPALPNEAS